MSFCSDTNSTGKLRSHCSRDRETPGSSGDIACQFERRYLSSAPANLFEYQVLAIDSNESDSSYSYSSDRDISDSNSCGSVDIDSSDGDFEESDIRDNNSSDGYCSDSYCSDSYCSDSDRSV